jgi:uncharacterized protein (TIGR02246 family)
MFPPVSTSSPEALHDAFVRAINARDLASALELWAEDAAIVGPDGSGASGRAQIAGALQTLLDNDVTLHIDLTNLVAAGDVAVATGSLTVSGTGADGSAFSSRSSSVVVYTRAPDGWRIALDAPWGLPTPRGTS